MIVTGHMTKPTERRPATANDL